MIAFTNQTQKWSKMSGAEFILSLYRRQHFLFVIAEFLLAGRADDMLFSLCILYVCAHYLPEKGLFNDGLAHFAFHDAGNSP
jgi:hypothetical protein